MLTTLLFTNIFLFVYTEGVDRTYQMFPVPLELPHRNDKAEQCWVRIEDNEIVETVAVYCYIAEGFLRNYIHDYNSRKMIEDDVDVSLWSEEPRNPEDISPKIDQKSSVIDWKVTTILDPIMRMRLYVSRDAYCRLIMYSREATTNYKVDCDKILFFVNDRMASSAHLRHVKSSTILLIAVASIIL